MPGSGMGIEFTGSMDAESADRLKALITLYLKRGIFALGREQEEVVAFWETAREEAPRLNVPFDPVWFAAQGLAASAALCTPSRAPRRPAEIAADNASR